MSFANRHNHGAIFEVNTEGFEFKTLQQLQDANDPDRVFTLRGLYINRKSKYGDAPVAILNDCFVNLPKHLTDEVRSILMNAEDVADINAGKVGFSIREYDDKAFKKHCYSITWEDVK